MKEKERSRAPVTCQELNFFSNPRFWFYQALNTIKSLWPNFQRDSDFYCVSCPGFVADNESDETKELRKRYAETREKIFDYYNKKDMVEATLSLFNQRVPKINRINLCLKQ